MDFMLCHFPLVFLRCGFCSSLYWECSFCSLFLLCKRSSPCWKLTLIVCFGHVSLGGDPGEDPEHAGVTFTGLAWEILGAFPKSWRSLELSSRQSWGILGLKRMMTTGLETWGIFCGLIQPKCLASLLTIGHRLGWWTSQLRRIGGIQKLLKVFLPLSNNVPT